GNYMVSMKMACLVGVSGVPRMSVYGVPQGATSTIPVLTGTTPLNTGLFNGAGAILLGKVLVPGTCNNNYTNVGFNFNANILPGPIDRIFLTRDDPVGLDNGGSTFLAVDSFCVKPILDPGTCQCGVLQWATIQQKWTSPQPLSCNGPFIGVPCTKPGSDYFVHGNFTCSPAACGNNTVTWVLDRPAPLPDITGSTSTSPYPHFDISLLAGYFTVSGNYSLTVSRMCGTTPCHCKLNFKIDACPCLCDPDPAFAQSVGLGFSMSSVIFPPTPCKKRFKPISLCPNDMVTWTVPGVGTFTSTGNAPITVTFPSSGTYYVCMIVKRTEPNGTQCTREFCRKVIVTCGIGPLDPVTSFCTDMKVRNAGFNQGMIPGVLNEWGALSDWELAPNPGEGLVFVEDSTGSLDDGHVVLVGRQNNFAGIMQEVNLLPDNFTVIKFEAINYLGAGLPAGTRIELRLQEYPYLYPDLKKQVLLSQAIGDSSGWHRIERTVNLTLDSSLHYLVICLQNDDETRNSIVGLDNLELCSSPVSDAPELGYQSVHIRIYPNPNSGTFSVELPESPKPGMMFRITDLAGRLMQEQKTEPGSIQQTIRTGELPNGLYFLQVVSEGKVLAVEKFVKQ
ncbi:MAG: T9SS type A sorting domain-containing protein, partial [Saprospiraceae bacterium]